MKAPRCGDCRYLDIPAKNWDVGTCRRYPPVPQSPVLFNLYRLAACTLGSHYNLDLEDHMGDTLEDLIDQAYLEKVGWGDFPVVTLDRWCGEFRGRSSEDEQMLQAKWAEEEEEPPDAEVKLLLAKEGKA